MNIAVLAASLMFAVLLSVPDAAGAKESGPDTPQIPNVDVEVNAQKAASLQEFEFGIAIGLEHFDESYIREAKTYGDNRTVRVTDRQDINTSIWLETHYTWDGLAVSKLGRTHSAPGFYVGARLLGENSEVFDAFSVGLMWAFKRTRLDEPSGSDQSFNSINVGVGPVWHRTRTLAGGIKEGGDLPVEYGDIEYKKEDEVSWMLMVSTGF